MSPQPPQPPAQLNAPGAVDLAALKEPTDDRRQQVLAQLLGQAKLICECGELIEDQGIEFIMLIEGIVQHPQRGPQRGLTLNSTPLHARTCPAFAGLLQAAEIMRQRGEVKMIAVRPISDIEWILTGREEAEEA